MKEKKERTNKQTDKGNKERTKERKKERQTKRKKEHEKEEGGPERSPRPTSHGARANSKGKFPFSLVANSFFGALFYSTRSIKYNK